jgi:hypothetical protein
MIRWSQAVGLAQGNVQQHKLLQDPAVQCAMSELLAWAVWIF